MASLVIVFSAVLVYRADRQTESHTDAAKRLTPAIGTPFDTPAPYPCLGETNLTNENICKHVYPCHFHMLQLSLPAPRLLRLCKARTVECQLHLIPKAVTVTGLDTDCYRM